MHAPDSEKTYIIGQKLSNLKVGGLCHGYGGLEAGLRKVLPSATTVLLSEWNIDACALLLERMDAGLLELTPIWTDLRTIPWEDLDGTIDCLTGGFPCQPFSAAGLRGADEDERHLFPHFVRGISALQPRLVVLENVPGIISARLSGDKWRDPAGTPVGLHVLRELERLGYIASLQFSSASEVGLPHSRQRVFFIAVRSDLVSDAEVLGCGGVDGPRYVEDECQGKPGTAVGEGCRVRSETGGSGTPPARVSGPGQVQQDWEYPRVIDLNTEVTTVTPVGGAAHGDRPDMGCSAAALRDPATWETAIRLVGNGVVPAVAELAIRRGLKEIFCS